MCPHKLYWFNTEGSIVETTLKIAKRNYHKDCYQNTNVDALHGNEEQRGIEYNLCTYIYWQFYNDILWYKWINKRSPVELFCSQVVHIK